MNAPAAFSGDYVDLKFIKSRKCAQIVVEIPIEQAASFVAAFGAPDPSTGVPVALARLQTGKADSDTAIPESKERRAFRDLPLAQQAGMRCGEAAFRRFLTEHLRLSNRPETAADAAVVVRRECGVASRAELESNPAAGEAWRSLNEIYEWWLRVPA